VPTDGAALCVAVTCRCAASFAGAVLLYRSYTLLTVWGLSLLLAAAWKGASQYNYYLGTRIGLAHTHVPNVVASACSL
jgi:hypothetical protein